MEIKCEHFNDKIGQCYLTGDECCYEEDFTKCLHFKMIAKNDWFCPTCKKYFDKPRIVNGDLPLQRDKYNQYRCKYCNKAGCYKVWWENIPPTPSIKTNQDDEIIKNFSTVKKPVKMKNKKKKNLIDFI